MAMKMGDIRRPALSMFRAFKRLLEDRRGVGAVEFAMIAPIMFIMYFVTIEASQAITTNKKVGRIASMVADLVTQQQDTVTAVEADAIMQIGQSIIQPYSRSQPTISITAIEITPANPASQVRVAWSRRQAGSGTGCPPLPALPQAGSPATVPTALNIPGTFLIRVETDLCYKPMIFWNDSQENALGFAAAFNDFPMHETYYNRPRMGTTIVCTGC
ncbi:TadE/TadG family type IV pilus assembly protein [Mesorhizobium sp. CN2-181]|uniref:TadE/TadG family type IV pilus assembly protein n=1 Tax=Mesorhizobium yinganensis TaxID=3157707 RepID=UPI0032B73B89